MSLSTWWNSLWPSSSRTVSEDQLGHGTKAMYRLMNSLYAPMRWMKTIMQKVNTDTQNEERELRNPVAQVVNFYIAHLWHGSIRDAFPIQKRVKGEIDRDILTEETDPKLNNLLLRVDDIMRWSNAGQKKEVWVREAALMGGWLCRVVSDTSGGASRPDMICLQSVPNEYVTDIEIDDQLHVQYLRIDVPFTKRQEDESKKAYCRTEIWEKSSGMRMWEHEHGEEASLTILGDPMVTKTLQQVGTGTFLPWVYAPFRDIGETKGLDAVSFAFEKVATANDNARFLNSMIFRNGGPLWVGLSDARDAQGRLLPPPKLNVDGTVNSDILDLSGEKFLSTTFRDVKCMVPGVNYREILEVVQAHESEIEKDLPETLWASGVSRAVKNGQIAAQTVRLLMEPAMARVRQVTANMNAGMVRVLQIALTMGQNLGIAEFSAAEIGTYEAGDFDIEIKDRDLYPLTDIERGQAQLVQAQADKAMMDNGIPFEMILQERGYSRSQIKRILENREKVLAEQREREEAKTAPKEDRKKVVTHTGLAESNVENGAVVSVGKDDGK